MTEATVMTDHPVWGAGIFVAFHLAGPPFVRRFPGI